MDKPKIFVVYGHDNVVNKELELLLQSLDLEPFILKNTANSSMTIIETLEHHIYSGIDFGIVLLTPDDLAYQADMPDLVQYRARQNVILELGMLIATIHRNNIAILKKGSIEIPSDLNGVFYYEFTEHIKEVAGKMCECMIRSGINISPVKLAHMGGL